MLQLPKIIKKTLSVRISMMVVIAMALLLLASLFVMLHYTRRAVKEEALNKATQTLEATVLHIDNLLLSVEQTTGNIYMNLMDHLDNPDMMFTYSRELVESNPYVAGCAIAFKENYYPNRQHFMAYVHRDDSANVAYAHTNLVRDDMFGNTPYTTQWWYTHPMTTGKATWLNPLKGMDCDEAPITTFSLPIPGKDGEPIGVIGVDVSLSLLSNVVEAAKPSPNSYCTLIDQEGTYIVHPDKGKLLRQVLFMLPGKEQEARQAAEAMTSGKTGYLSFVMNGTPYYIFYKPFRRAVIPGRSLEELGWSAGIVYPEKDILGEYDQLLYYVLAIAVIGLLLLFVIYRFIIHRQLLPLQMLTKKAQHIAEGHYNETIPDSKHHDEIGRLQSNFLQMQQSLSAYISEQEQLEATIQEQGKNLQKAYKEAQKADRMKMAFLHNMTNQLLEPADSMREDVLALCSQQQKDARETVRLTESIKKKGEAVAELLKNFINLSDEEIRKEADHA